MSDRLQALQSMLAEDPANSFARYGLAMEYMKAGDNQMAVDQFRALLEADPNYAAAYYHSGQTLERMGEIDLAREMYQRGIEVTLRTGDAHTRSELQAALELLPI